MKALAVGHNARYGTALCMLSAILLFVHGTHTYTQDGFKVFCSPVIFYSFPYVYFQFIRTDFSQQEMGKWEYLCYRCDVIDSLYVLYIFIVAFCQVLVLLQV